MEAVEKYVSEFRDLVKADGYLPKHVFSCDQTGLFRQNLNGLASMERIIHVWTQAH